MIFGVGLSKTGTTSLGAALDRLGLRCVHYPPAGAMLAGDFSVLDDYDAACDISVSAVFRELDRAFPGARFLLTTRDEDRWLASAERNFAPHLIEKYDGRPEAEVFRRVYGVTRFDRRAFIDARRRHEDAVRAHFRRRPDDLLELDLCADPSWDALCGFLGVDTPGEPFPHENATRPAPAT